MESYSQKTEKIMRIFSRFSDNCIIDLQPPEYNKAYIYIAKCLLEFELEKNGYDAYREAVKALVENVARIAYNYGFQQGMIEARPFSNGGIDFQTAWDRMQEGEQFKKAIAAVERLEG